jgi:uncharacterized protein (DUF697 family)
MIDQDREADRVSDADLTQTALKLIDRHVLWAGGAGLIPLPFVDMAAVSIVQLQMLRKLTGLYDVRFSENLGKSILASLVGVIIPATSGIGLASATKGLPLIGTAVGVAVMPGLSAGATYIIGRVFMQHFASGGTLLDFSVRNYRGFIKEQTDKLKARLDAPSTSTRPSVAEPAPASSAPASSAPPETPRRRRPAKADA